MEEFILKTKGSNKGFTLIEGILAIAIASIGLVLILSLIGMGLEINIKSQYQLKDSSQINSLADHLRSQKNIQADDQAIDSWLQAVYPDFRLIEFYETAVKNIWTYHLEGNGQEYHITVYGEQNE